MSRTLLERYADRMADEMEDCWRLQSTLSNEHVRLTYSHRAVWLSTLDGREVDRAEADDLHDAIRELHRRVTAKFEALPVAFPRGSAT